MVCRPEISPWYRCAQCSLSVLCCPNNLVLTRICCFRKSLAAPSSNLPLKAKIASVCLRLLPSHHIQQFLTPKLHTVLHKGANFALPDLPNDIEQRLIGISHLLLQNEIPWASTLAYLEYAHARGIVTIFNPSPMPADTQLHAFPWAALSWLIVNEGEADSLLRAIGGNPGNHKVEEENPADWPDDNTLRLAFSTLSDLRRGEHLASTSVICTLGAAGVLASICGLKEILYLPAATLQGDVRDTTGAGDCLTGYFVTGLMEFKNKQLSKDEAFGLLRLSVQVCPPYPQANCLYTTNNLGGRNVCRKERRDGIYSRAWGRRGPAISKINVYNGLQLRKRQKWPGKSCFINAMHQLLGCVFKVTAPTVIAIADPFSFSCHLKWTTAPSSSDHHD